MFDSRQDLLNGNPYRCIIAFAVPLFIGNIFQQLYNMVDAAVVGRLHYYLQDPAVCRYYSNDYRPFLLQTTSQVDGNPSGCFR